MEIKNIRGIIEYDSLYRRNIEYVINEGMNDAYTIFFKLPFEEKISLGNNIIEAKPFINGYSIVKLDNHVYGYMRETDKVLLPYRYHIATNFNKYGYALVAMNGRVSWINKKFEYIANNGYMHFGNSNFNGFDKVYIFNEDASPISRIENDGVLYEFNTNEELKVKKLIKD